uniref:Uncharacterized protein n=1 Tax=Siphoviridae sp. ctdmY20 TaxID=2825586 RepID=A0A8S5QB07_9CAUD|nr:MAG TPA: hypothetical protein [Siphoviridae sp. ctdmY20]
MMTFFDIRPPYPKEQHFTSCKARQVLLCPPRALHCPGKEIADARRKSYKKNAGCASDSMKTVQFLQQYYCKLFLCCMQDLIGCTGKKIMIQ